MKIGLLSDTHDNVANLEAALEVFRSEGILALFHCGDMTSADTVRHLAGFDVVYLTGNMDRTAEGVCQALLALNPGNCAELTFTGEFDGTRVAATHGHIEEALGGLVRSGRYAYVFHGHTHRRRDETAGKTRILNPGALGGLHAEYRSICLLDLATDEARFVKIED